MKKILLAILLLFVFQHGFSQVLISLIFGDKLNSDKIEFGLDGGLSLTTLKGPEGAKNRSGLNLGFYLDIKTKNPAWMVSTGVMVKGPMGAQGLPVYGLENTNLDSVFKGGSVTTNLGYFYVPVTMKYSFKNHLFIKGGIQLGLINAASDDFVNSITDNDDLTHTINRKKDFAALDAGLAAGVGYRLMKGNGMNINISYYYGLVDVESSDNGADVFNRALYFNVGIPIGKGKAAKKAAEKK
jgi:hypothetical protein